MKRVVGIDFGTSTSIMKIKMYQDDYTVPAGETMDYKSISFENGSVFVPTLIRKGASDMVYYGHKAAPFHSNTTLYGSFKVDLQSEDEEKQNAAKALTKEFFGYLFGVYQSQKMHGMIGDVDATEETLISYPVKWGSEQREFMIEAAEEAGFTNVRGMDEAEAAIKAAVLQNAQNLRQLGYGCAETVKILMIDMGAGTTDLAIGDYHIREDRFDVQCVYPTRESKIFFGGHEIDTCLAEYIRGKTDAVAGNGIITQLLNNESFKEWKENTVSPMLSDDKTVDCFSAYDMCVGMAGIAHEDYAFGRKEFETNFKSYLNCFPTLINECFRETGADKQQIDLVVLTGGHSQWYFVREMLCDRLEGYDPVGLEKIKNDPSRILSLPCPQETVTFGLVYSKLPTVVNQQKKPIDAFELLHREEFARVAASRLKFQILSILEEMNPKISAMIADSTSAPDLRTVLSIPQNEGLLCGHLFPDLQHSGGKMGFALSNEGIYCRDTELFFVSWWDLINGDIIIPVPGDRSLSFKNKGMSSVIACWEECDLPRCGFVVFQMLLLVQENLWNIKKKTRSAAKKRKQEQKNAVSDT